MLLIQNAVTLSGAPINFTVASDADDTLDARGLTMLPALIDPHVHFRTPGLEYKEDWRSGAAAAIAGGVTTVFDMPNTNPATTTLPLLLEKKAMIEKQLGDADIPLRYHLYLGASKHHLDQITAAKEAYIGIKVFLGQSTGTLLMDDDAAFREVCKRAAELGVIVAIHAEDEAVLRAAAEQFAGETDPSVHSKIRDRRAAITALEKALASAKTFGTKLYVLHASTREEIELIRQAKNEGMQVALETTPHHLFLSVDAYARLGAKAQMNPPLRTRDDQDALWEGVNDGTIDMIGTDHAPHTLEEKTRPYGQAPSGVPGIETMLPLLITAARDGRVSLETIPRITRWNAERFFGLAPQDDVTLVDLATTHPVDEKKLKTKCSWSPFAGWELTGWPVYTVLKGRVYPAS